MELPQRCKSLQWTSNNLNRNLGPFLLVFLFLFWTTLLQLSGFHCTYNLDHPRCFREVSMMVVLKVYSRVAGWSWKLGPSSRICLGECSAKVGMIPKLRQYKAVKN